MCLTYSRWDPILKQVKYQYVSTLSCAHNLLSISRKLQRHDGTASVRIVRSMTEIDDLALCWAKCIQIDKMHYRIQCTINEILLILAHIHIRHGPIDILGRYSLFEFPVVRIRCIKEHDMTLAWGIKQVSFWGKLASVDRAVRTFITVIELNNHQQKSYKYMVGNEILIIFGHLCFHYPPLSLFAQPQLLQVYWLFH